MLRRLFALFLIVSATALLAMDKAHAQSSFPSRPITLIGPYPAGGGADTAMRGIAQEMQTILGQPVLVEARPGANGTIAGNYVSQAKADGYTVGLFQSTQAIPEVYSDFQKPPYTSEKLRPVARYMSLVYGLPSRANAPWKTMTELVTYIKANPGKVKWGRTIGAGHPLHLIAFSIIKKENLKVVEVPFKGAADAITALLGGHIDVAFGASTTSLAGHVNAGRLSILAIHNNARLSSLPDVPTFSELGLDPGSVPIYNTFFVPKGTPDDIVAKLHDAVKKAIETPALIEFTKKNGIELYYGSEKDALDEINRDREISTKLIAELKKDMPAK